MGGGGRPPYISLFISAKVGDDVRTHPLQFQNSGDTNLRVRDAASAITFYQQAFGAVEVRGLTDLDGKVVNALLSIGEALFVVAEESPKTGSPSPQTLGGSPVSIDLSVPDVDVTVDQAVAAGAVV